MILNDLINLLGAAESEMIWSFGKANLISRSTFQNTMDIDNGNIGYLEKSSLPNEREWP